MRTKKTVTVYKTVITKKRVKLKITKWQVEPCYVRLGQAIAACRKEAGLTQTDLAEKLKLWSRPALANMEKGKQRIYLHHIFLIEKALGLKDNYLINIARGKHT